MVGMSFSLHLLLPPPNGEGYVYTSVDMLVCLLAALREIDEWIFIEFSGYVGQDTKNSLEYFGSVPDHHYERIFRKFSG